MLFPQCKMLRPAAPLYNRIISPPLPCLLTSRPRILPRYFDFGIPLRAFVPHRPLHTALWPPLFVANILLALWAYKVHHFDKKRMRLNFGCAVHDADYLAKQTNLPSLFTARRTAGNHRRLLAAIAWT